MCVEVMSNPSEPDLKPLRCRVCARASNTGHHYGVTACLGCKTFFRRVVLQASELTCKFEGKCALQKGGPTKRICRRCRYEKCKQIGMKEEALHPCRDLIGRRKDSHSDSSEGSPSTSSSIHAYSPDEEEALAFVRGLRDIDCNVHRESRICTSSSPLNSSLTSLLRCELSRLRLWASRVPGFNELALSTRRYLLHRFCLMSFVLEQSIRTARGEEQDNWWLLTDGTCLAKDMVSLHDRMRSELTDKVEKEQQLLFPLTSLVMDEVVKPMRRVQPSDEEVASLKVLMLMKPTILDRMTSEIDRQSLLAFRNRVLRGLHVFYGHRSDAACRLGEVLMLCGPIEIAATFVLEHMHLVRFFDVGSFDEDTENVIFGTTT